MVVGIPDGGLGRAVGLEFSFENAFSRMETEQGVDLVLEGFVCGKGIARTGGWERGQFEMRSQSLPVIPESGAQFLFSFAQTEFGPVFSGASDFVRYPISTAM